MVAIVRHQDLACCADGRIPGVIQLPQLGSVRSPCGQEVPVGCELLDPGVAELGLIEVPHRIESQPGRRAQLAVSLHRHAHGSERVSLKWQLHDAVTAHIGGVHVPLEIHHDALHPRGDPGHGTSACALWREFGDPRSGTDTLGHVDVAVVIKVHKAGTFMAHTGEPLVHGSARSTVARTRRTTCVCSPMALVRFCAW